MSTYKDTLTLYEELVASGVPEGQAKVQAHQLGSVGDYMGNAINNMNAKFVEMDRKLEKIDKDLIWMRVIGAAMIVAFLSNAWFK